MLTLIAGALELTSASSKPNLKNIRAANLGLLLLLAVILFVTGIADVQAISLCTVQLPNAAVMVLSILIMLSFVTGIAVVATRFILEAWLKAEPGEIRFVTEKNVEYNGRTGTTKYWRGLSIKHLLNSGGGTGNNSERSGIAAPS